MRISKVKRLCIIILVVTLIVSILVGCSSNDKTATVSKQEITYSLGGEPRNLDPALCTDTIGMMILANAFSGLAELDDKDKAIPGQAEKWEVSDDKLTYIFHLKKDLKWSNGDSLTAKDYEYEWKRVLNPETASKYAYALYYIKGGEAYNKGKESVDAVGIKATDDNTLVVTLEVPCPYFLELTAQSYYFPVDEKVVEGSKDWANDVRTLVSNGPFEFKDYKIKDQIILGKNENYYDKDKVKLDKIVMKCDIEETLGWESYISGQFDIVNTVPKVDMQVALKDGSAKTFPNYSTYYLSINVSDKANDVDSNAAKALSDSRVRQALSLAINRKSIVDNVLKTNQVPASGVVAKGCLDVNGKDYREEKSYFEAEGNVEEAKKLLADAGYPEGQGLPIIQLLYNPETDDSEIMQAIQDMWKKIGVNAELKSQEFEEFLTARVQKQYIIARDGWNGDCVDPMTFLDLFASNSKHNNSGYKNPTYDAKIDEARKEIDINKRFDLLHQAEDILMNDMPIIPLYYYTRTIGIKDYVKSIRVSLLDMIYFKNAYVEGKNNFKAK